LTKDKKYCYEMNPGGNYRLAEWTWLC